MKRTIFLTAIALLISAGITAQSTNKTQNQSKQQTGTQTQTKQQTGTQTQTQQQTGDPAQTQQQTGDQSQLQTHKRDQLRTHDQTGTGDQIRKRDQTRLQDPSKTMSQTGTQNAQLKNQSASQVRRNQLNDGARSSVMNRNMRMSTVSGARRR